jgi:DNA-binding CsgD family transcriptional regulator/competence protein ComGC
MDMASAFDTLNQSDSALKYYKEYQTVADSLNSVEKENKLNELKEQYEADLKEEQLRNNAQEIHLLEKSNSAKSQRNITLVSILIVVLALTISIISRQRNSIKLKTLIADQKEKAHQAEIQAQTLERQKLEEDLNHRKRELANQALLIAEKNELLRSFRSEVEKVGEAETEAKRSLNSISRKMERAENQQGDWDKFMQLFKDVHPELLSKLSHSHPDLTHNDLRLLALMKMGFSNKEIADILHITEGGLKKARYRLRKKLDLELQASIHQYIQNI